MNRIRKMLYLCSKVEEVVYETTKDHKIDYEQGERFT